MSDAIDEPCMMQSGGYQFNEAIIIDDGSGEPSVVAFVKDAESDVLMLRFNLEGEVEIQTERYSYITLFKSLLSELEGMIDEAGEHWEQLQKYWDEKQDTWVGWEHLATQPENPN